MDLDPRAQLDPLAVELRRRVERSLEARDARDSFERMWGTIVLVRSQVELLLPTQPGFVSRELSLRFDYGKLTVHAGRVGRPDVSIWGTDREMLDFAKWCAPRTEWFPGATWTTISRRVDAVRATCAALAGLGLSVEIYGRFSHPRLVYRFARLVS